MIEMTKSWFNILFFSLSIIFFSLTFSGLGHISKNN